jgi:hypothetical protein
MLSPKNRLKGRPAALYPLIRWLEVAQNQLYGCEHMVFNLWNCPPEHRSLGSVNRTRLALYLASRAGTAETEHGVS